MAEKRWSHRRRLGMPLALSIVGLMLGSGCMAPYGGGGLPAGVSATGGPGCTDCVAGESGTTEPWRAYTIGSRIHRMLTCGGGCGSLYWGEWSYDPPPAKGCDRCDLDGHWIGPQPCGADRCHHIGLKGIWGTRYCAQCGGPCQGCEERAAGSTGTAVPLVESAVVDGPTVPAPRATHKGIPIEKKP